MKRFEGKIALVTGGGSGIGRASALRFAGEGADVIVADIVAERAQAVVSEIEALGQKGFAIRADVSAIQDVADMIDGALKHFERLDVMFNNAGIGGQSSPVKDMPVEEWDRVLAVNLRAVFLCCRYGIPALIQSGGGAIVNMGSSMAGWDTLAGSAAYMASKEGVTGLTKNLALELGGYGIRVNAICPGIIQTELSFQQGTHAQPQQDYFERFRKRIPLRRVGQPEDVAAAVAFLASDDARHITGSMLLIDGGQTLQSWSNAPGDEQYPLHAKRA
jgi:NAD(P)-dependent dehydrogenase (short-subunit alcohol dehydrogenase family)